MGINSKQKGARGERLWRDELRKYGVEARRGRQYSGDPSAPDVITNLNNLHFEVKFVEKLNIREAMKQAKKDAGEKRIPVVAHKTSRDDWLITIQANDYLSILVDWSKRKMEESV